MTIVVSTAGFAGIAQQPFGAHSCSGIMIQFHSGCALYTRLDTQWLQTPTLQMTFCCNSIVCSMETLAAKLNTFVKTS